MTDPNEPASAGVPPSAAGYTVPPMPGAHEPSDPPPQTRPPGTRRRRWLIIAAMAGGLVLIAGVVVALLIRADRQADREAAEADALARTNAATSVQTMLQAIADGDAATALSYVGDSRFDDALLTDEVLAASAAVAPITGISVVEPAAITATFRSGEVAATYTLGQTEVTREYQVSDFDGDGAFDVTGVLAVGEFFDLEGLALSVNGVAVPEVDELSLFPGSYQVATTMEYFALEGTTEFTVADTGTTYLNDIVAGLTDDGLAAFRGAVTGAVEECLSSKELVAGCGLELPPTLSDGTELVDGTVERTLNSRARDALEVMEPSMGAADLPLVGGQFVGVVAVDVGCVTETQEGTCTLEGDLPALGQPFVDMSGEDLTVTW